MYDLSEEIKLDKNKKHNIDIVVDRLAVKEGIESRLTDSIETVLKLAEGLVKVDVIGGETMLFSDSFPARIVASASRRSSREASRSTTHLAHVLAVRDLDSRQNLILT